MPTSIKSLQAIHIQARIREAAEEATEQKDAQLTDQPPAQELEAAIHEELAARQAKR